MVVCRHHLAWAKNRQREGLRTNHPLTHLGSCGRSTIENDAGVIDKVEASFIHGRTAASISISVHGPSGFAVDSWTGQAVYRVKLKHSPNGIAEVEEALWSKDLADTSKWDVHYEAQLIDFVISNLLLGQSRPFPRLAGLDDHKLQLLQHASQGLDIRHQLKTPARGSVQTLRLLCSIFSDWEL